MIEQLDPATVIPRQAKHEAPTAASQPAAPPQPGFGNTISTIEPAASV
jgi:hypothetical protein